MSASLATILSCGTWCGAQTEREFADARAIMVETAVAAAGIKDPAILAVMRDVPRHRFVPAEMRQYAYRDMALPIGQRQTISPPFIVAYMTQKLDLKPHDKVLEIGTGSGYQAAVLSRLIEAVYTIEIVEPLGQRAGATFKSLGYGNIHARIGDGYQGWPEHAPFDKIIVTCSPERVPQPLVDQLREGGRIVIPIGERYQQLLCSLVKRDGKLKVESREPTHFVPMTGAADSLRQHPSGEGLTPLVNGDFEQLLEPGKPAGWYYLRQATLEESTTGGKRFLTFRNRVPGCSSQALQALGIDGRTVDELVVEARVRGTDVRVGALPHQQAQVMLNFFDEKREPMGQIVVGPWKGSFDWSHKTARLKVPAEARGIIVAVGLLGATGEFSCDDLTIRPVVKRAARR